VFTVACLPSNPPPTTTTTTSTTSTIPCDSATTTTTEDTTTTTEDTTTTTEDTTTTTEDTTTTTEGTTTTTGPLCESTTTTTVETTTTTSVDPTTTTTGPTRTAPDVLVVMLDDLSIDTAPYYMPRTYAKMAGDHWYEFNQAVVPTPLCGPSRATFLTGQTVDHHGMNCNASNTAVCESWVANRSKLVPKALADAGVWVGWYGKRVNWDHECKAAEGATSGWPNLPGVVDDHVHYLDTAELFNSYTLIENGAVNQYSVATQGPSAYGTYKTADLALAGIESCESPCALYWMPQAPHSPGTPPPDFDPTKVLPGAPEWQPPFNEGCPGAFDPDTSDKTWVVNNFAPCVGANTWKRTKWSKSLQGVDNRLPELIDAFLAKNPENAKRILFTSDHGSELGNHRHTAKEDPWEMSIRVPLFIYDSESPGGVVDELVNIRDVPATLLDWQGASPLLPLDGRSLVPLYAGTAADWYTDTYISHLRTTNALDNLRPWRALRQDCAVAAAENRHCLKLIHYPAGSVDIKDRGTIALPDEWEVYLLDQDPWELTNVHANAYTGYLGVPGWDDSNPELAAAKAALFARAAAGA
jgi:arylsulfatase A-like enzyme